MTHADQAACPPIAEPVRALTASPAAIQSAAPTNRTAEPASSASDRRWFLAGLGSLAGLAAAPQAASAASPDGELLQLGAEFDVLELEYFDANLRSAPREEAMATEFARRHELGEFLGNAGCIAVLERIEREYPVEAPDVTDVLDRMDDPMCRIIGTPATTIQGLAVKARAARNACSHFWKELDDHCNWDHLHARKLIEAVLALAGERR